MFTKILVPLDGSALAERVLPYVVEMALEHESELVLARAVPPVDVLVTGAGYLDLEVANDLQVFALADAEAYINAKCGELRAQGVHAHGVVLEGAAATLLLDLATREQCDLIAMTTHGRTGVSRLLHGSVAEELLHTTACPVFLVTVKNMHAPVSHVPDVTTTVTV